MKTFFPSPRFRCLFASMLVVLLAGAKFSAAQDADDRVTAGDSLAKIQSEVAKLAETVAAAKAAVESAGKSTEESAAEIDMAIASARQILSTLASDGEMASLVERAIEVSRAELKTIEQETLGDKEAQAMLAEIRVDFEYDLDKLYENKIRMVEAAAIARRELERFEKVKRVYQIIVRAGRIKTANEQLIQVIEGTVNLANALSEITVSPRESAGEIRPSPD